MSDNVQASLAVGSGPIFKTDQDSGDQSHCPFTKLMFGALDTFTIVSMSNGMPVQFVAGSTVALAAGGAVIGHVLVDSLPAIALAAGGAVIGHILVDSLPALAAGSATIGALVADQTVNLNKIAGTATAVNSGNKDNGTQRVVLATDQPALTNAQPVNDKPATAGGLTMHKAISAASTNATSVKALPGQVYDIEVFNLNSAPRYLKLYNKASAPNVGSDVPVKTLLIPGNAAGAGLVKNWDKGLEFTTGLAYALTTGIGDADTGAVAANELAVNLDYK